jgi:hypothetical protein
MNKSYTYVKKLEADGHILFQSSQLLCGADLRGINPTDTYDL